MTIEYGYRRGDNTENWNMSLHVARRMCEKRGYTLIAREVSDPWVVSIRD